MKDLLSYVLAALVEHPEDLRIEETIDNERTLYTIHPHADDIGKIIGKQGRIIRAVRDLVKLVATKQGIYADVAIAE